MKKFSRLTENIEVLCNIWQEDLGFQKKYKLWTKEFEKALYKCFKRIHPKEGKTLIGNKMVVKLNRLKSRLKQYTMKGKN